MIAELLKWLLKVRIRLVILVHTRIFLSAGKIIDITPWRGVLVVQAQYGVYVICDHRNYLSDWEVHMINHNRYRGDEK